MTHTENFYTQDGLTQVTTCKCDDCLEVLQDSDSWIIDRNTWSPATAWQKIAPYHEPDTEWSYQDISDTFFLLMVHTK